MTFEFASPTSNSGDSSLSAVIYG